MLAEYSYIPENVCKRHRFKRLAFGKILSALLLSADYIYCDLSPDFLGNIDISPRLPVYLTKYSRDSAFQSMASHGISIHVYAG